MNVFALQQVAAIRVEVERLRSSVQELSVEIQVYSIYFSFPLNFIMFLIILKVWAAK